MKYSKLANELQDLRNEYMLSQGAYRQYLALLQEMEDLKKIKMRYYWKYGILNSDNVPTYIGEFSDETSVEDISGNDTIKIMMG